MIRMKEVAEEGINATPYVEVQWKDSTKQKALFDTGAQWSLVSEEVLTDKEQQEMRSSNLIGKGVTGKQIPVIGEIWRDLQIGNTKFPNQRFVVVKQMICPVILGIDFWSRVSQLSFDFDNQTVRISDTDDCVKLWSHPFDHEVASTEMMGEKDPRLVFVKEDSILPAKSETYIQCLSEDMKQGKDYLIQPISQEDDLFSTPFGVIRANDRNEFEVRISNLGPSDIRVEKGTCIATLEEDVWVTHPNSGGAFRSNSPRTKEDILWDNMCDQGLDCNKKRQLVDLLKKHRSIFHTGGKLPIVRVGVEHTMNLQKDVQPTVCRPRRLSRELAEEVREHIERLLKEGVIRESNSEWASPIVCARRSDGSLRLVIDYRLTNEKSRTATLHPIPLIDDLIDHLSQAKYFSILDAKSGYHQMPLKRGDSAATAFVVPWGHYEFAERCPFGLKGAGYSFQRMMSAVLGNSNFVEALCYLDDILVWGETWEIHIQRVKGILIKIEKAGLALSVKKCLFGSTHVDYLGCTIGKGMLKISEQRVEQLRRIERPDTVKGLRSALGAFAYVQRWIPGLSELAKPLYDATMGGPYSRLRWTDQMQVAFDEIKRRIGNAVALSIPNMERGFVLVTDCSNIAAGAMLAQEAHDRSNQLIPCAFYHHALSKSESKYSATEKELLAIVLAVKKFRVYLGRRFKLITDHHALRWLKSLNPENETGRRGRWLDVLQQFDMEVIAKRGRSPEMRIADYLSRVTISGNCEEETTKGAVFLALESENDDQDQPLVNIAEILKCQDEDTKVSMVKKALQRGDDLNIGGSDSSNWRSPSTAEDEELERLWRLRERLQIDKHGVLRLKFNGGRRTSEHPFGSKEKWRIIVPQSYREAILNLVHASSSAAHMGTNRTWKRARNNFWWHDMKSDIDQFIRACTMCSMNKHVNRNNEAPMSKASIPHGPLVEVMIDFVGPFQEARHHKFRYALQIQDVFSRFLIFEPTVDSTATTAAIALKNRWISIFGMPQSLRSDRGRHFTGEVFEELCRLSGVKHKLGSPEHPQSQGQVERQNQLINQVRCLCENDIEKWPEALCSVQYSHNGAVNSSTGLSPGRILFGKRVSYPEDILFRDNVAPSTINVQKLSKLREEEDEALMDLVKQRVQKCQDKRNQAQSSYGVPYRVGDRVRYRLNDDTRSRKGGKIAPRYSEEYEVIDVLGDGYTYNLRAVNHNGRAKSRHFNLLKTVRRIEEDDKANASSRSEDDENMSSTVSGDSSEIPTSGDREVTEEVNLPGYAQPRRSHRDRKEVQRLQADGTKKSYTSSTAENYDSE